MPRMIPSRSARNFTPSSTALVSWVLSTVAGLALAGQIVHGHPTGVLVVKIHETSCSSVSPPRSFTPAPPLLTTAMYSVPAASADVGSSVATRVAALYETLAGTRAPVEATCRRNVDVVTVDAWTASL